MDISVVIPLYNEAESLPELYAWIDRVMKEHGFSYEVVMVDDGSMEFLLQVELLPLLEFLQLLISLLQELLLQ